METQRLRRTRFVCISDTHNSNVHLPDGDVLIHAGDLTNQGSHSEVRSPETDITESLLTDIAAFKDGQVARECRF